MASKTVTRCILRRPRYFAVPSLPGEGSEGTANDRGRLRIRLALTAAFSLACLEIRSRSEEAINSTRNRIYSLKVFYWPALSTSSVLIYLLFVFELI